MKLSYRTKMEQVYFSEFQEQMEGTGLYAYGFRYYDPVIGRFTGVDPIADQFAHLSGFNYASNDPIGKVDLHGLQGVDFNLLLFRRVARVPTMPGTARGNNANAHVGFLRISIAAQSSHSPFDLNLAGRQTFIGSGIDNRPLGYRMLGPKAAIEVHKSDVPKFVQDIMTKAANGKLLSPGERQLLRRANREFGTFVEDDPVNLNRNDREYFGQQLIYSITIDDEIYKYGKASAEADELDGNGYPKRLTNQIRDLKKLYGGSIISGRIHDKFMGTTGEAEQRETGYIEGHKSRTGSYPKGNIREQNRE